MATIPESEMLAPRLELRWEDKPDLRDGYTVECTYSLVIKLDEYDIRRERCDGDGNDLPDVSEASFKMGGTLSTGCSAKRYDPKADMVDPPFRDGAHAGWDTKQLGNLPIYAVAAGRACLMPNRKT